MAIQEIEIKNFRNLHDVALQANPFFNILHGFNGSGKTSFLEAIFFLSLGRSFRTRSIDNLIQEKMEQFSIFCKIQNKNGVTALGTQRMRSGEKRIRIDGKEENSYVGSAKILPLLLINTDEHQLITGGPDFRRQFINWGMFHVEQNFHSCWQRLQQALRHRNAILKKQGDADELAPWDNELILGACQLNEMRQYYIQRLIPHFKYFVSLLLENFENIELAYYSGWNEGEGLKKVLTRTLFRDRQLGYTQYGPHRMELNIKVNGHLVKDILSRGQQKLIVYALKLAQGMLLQKEQGQACIYLIDDFMAELDIQKRALVSQSLLALEAQVFVTGVEKQELREVIHNISTQMFHVEQGKIIGHI